MDASGRLLVPAELRKACGLSKEIVLVGLGSHFELWDAEKLAESEAKAMTENLSDIAAQFNFKNKVVFCAGRGLGSSPGTC